MTTIHLEQLFHDLVSKFGTGSPFEFDATLQFHLSGEGGGDWYMTLRDGKCEAAPGVAQLADAVLDTNLDDFVKLISDSQEEIGWAFMQGRFNMTGNILPLWRVLAFLHESHAVN